MTVSILFLVSLGVYVRSRGAVPGSRADVLKFAILWTGVFTFEYYYFLHHSYVWMTDEGDMFPPFYDFYERFHGGGLYSHALASGSDARAIFLIGDAVLHFDQILFKLFPTWIAILVHKLAVVTIGFSGAYLLLRKGVGTSRLTALALAALYTVIYHRMVNVTMGSGLGWVLLPSAVYVCVVRSDRRNYFRGVIAYAIGAACLMVPTQGLFPLVSALVGGAAMFRRINWRVAAGAAIMVAVILANWVESIYGMSLVAPHSAQGLLSGISTEPFFDRLIHHVGDALRKSWTYEVPVLASVISVAVLAIARKRSLVPVAAGLAIPFVGYVAFNLFPWHLLGMASVTNANSAYFLVGLFPLSIAGAAYAMRELPGLFGRWPAEKVVNVSGVVAMAAAVAVLGWYKGHNLAAHWQQGGQAAYDSITNLKERPWAPDKAFRVITLRHKNLAPESNIAFGYYGLDCFEAWLNLRIKAHEDYWRSGVHRETPELGVGIGWHRWDGRQYDLGAQVSFALLAAANVRFVLSPLPLKEDGLRLIDGPASPPKDAQITKMARKKDGSAGNVPLFQRIGDKIDLLAWRAGRLFGYGKLYIYEIDGALPRVYAASAVHVAANDLPVPEFLRVVEREAPKRVAVVPATEALGHRLSAAPLEIREVRLRGDGYDIEIDAPDGGTVVVNAVSQPFFSAYVDGNPAPFLAVNGVHTAIPVGAGARNVRLIYHRKRFADLFTAGRER